MGWRFYRRKKILPGVSINWSKSGPSVSIGTRGAHITLGPRGARETVGIPGTGISYTTHQSTPSFGNRSRRLFLAGVIVLIAIGAVAIALFRLRPTFSRGIMSQVVAKSTAVFSRTFI